MAQAWWVWIAGALILAGLELAAPGFVFLGFAIGVAAVGGLLALGFSAGLPVLAVIGAAVSVLAWLGLRRLVGVRRGQSRIITRDINEE